MAARMGHTAFQLDRRLFLKAGLTSAASLAFGPAFLKRAFATGPVTVAPAGPYGPLLPFDANGIALPPGFTSREIARGGEIVSATGGDPYAWHFRTDGQATFPTLGAGSRPDRGWILVANSEVRGPPGGGVSAVEFGADGTVERAYRVLAGTMSNCAGGPTPWGTWLSCEEHVEGKVWECDPAGGPEDAVARPALGVFVHEAACVDPVNQRVYLTEDRPDGCWYRFTCDHYPDLSSGLLEVAVVDGAGTVTWKEVPEPGGGAANPTRAQVAEAAHFAGGEGLWYDEGKVYFTTKGDNRVWLYDVALSKLEVLYDAAAVGPTAPLEGVDNITVAPSGDVFVCEDGRDHDICLITPDFTISRFLKLDPTVHGGPAVGSVGAGNETVGVVFSPTGTHMYFGAQRSFAEAGETPKGVVYEISGPFRDPQPWPGPGDRVAPRFSIVIARRARLAAFLRYGHLVSVALDEPAGLVVRMEVEPTPGSGYRTIARSAPTVAVNGQTAVRLRPYAGVSRWLGRNGPVSALVTVEATDAAGNRRVASRSVTLR